jgi:hypothetical protein
MRKSRFTESQIVGILKQGEAGVPIAEALAGGVLSASALPAGPGRRCRHRVERGGRPT